MTLSNVCLLTMAWRYAWVGGTLVIPNFLNRLVKAQRTIAAGEVDGLIRDAGATGSERLTGADVLLASGVGRRSLREIETELKAKGFQNRNSTFSGSVLTKMLKVDDARLRKAVAMKRTQEAKD